MKTAVSRSLKIAIAIAAALARQKPMLAAYLAVCMLALALPARAQYPHPTFISFDPPGSYGTYPQCLNDTGEIPGYYYDNQGAAHGFVRSPDGVITEFDVRGAGIGSGQGTFPAGNNIEGVITGYVTDGSNVSHGFVRSPDGIITEFDVRRAGKGSGQGTFAWDINGLGVIAGDFVDDNSVAHGFVRAPDGGITTYEVTGAGTGAGQGVYTSTCDGINLEGALSGYYFDASNVAHGYLRARDGEITTFDAPGAGTEAGAPNCIATLSCPGTIPVGINTAGMVTAWYVDANYVIHGLLRSPDGTTTEIDASGAGDTKGSFQGTQPVNLNTEGAVTGSYEDASYFDHGFLRSPDGTIFPFEVPGAGSPPGGQGYGTIPYCNNDSNAITGYYSDSGGVWHGFLVLP